MKLKLALISFLFLCRPLFPDEPALPRLDDAAQDKQGVVWALARQERGKLHTFDGKEWKTVTVPFDDSFDATPVRFTALPNGEAACLWKLNEDRMAITRQAAGKSLLITAFPAKLQASDGIYPHLFFDSHERFWITGSGPEVHCVGLDGKIKATYNIPPDQLLKATTSGNSYNPLPYVGQTGDGRLITFSRETDESPTLRLRNADERCNSIYSVEDGHGRAWVWSNSRSTNRASLEGVLVFNDGKAEQHRQLNGIAGTLYSVIAKKDEKHMWVASSQEGLFEVDIDTFQATDAGPEPRLMAFAKIQMIFADGKDWYVITQGQGKDDLWRLREGKWKQILRDMDVSYRDADALPERAWLREEKGMLIRSIDGAPWFVTNDSPPARMDWRCGFGLGDARKFFRLKDGTFFAIGGKGETFSGTVSMPGEAAASRVSEFETETGWSVDARGHVWTVMKQKPNFIAEWDGDRWISHEIPIEMQNGVAGNEIMDTQGRLWLLPRIEWARTAYFDTRNGKWQIFPKLQDAWLGAKTELPKFQKERLDYFLPEYSVDGKRVAYRTRSEEVVYFDGKEWHRWKRGKDFAQRGGAMSVPFFTAEGKLCLLIGNDAWEFGDAQAQWSQVPVGDRHAPAKAANFESKSEVAAPEGCVTASPDSIAMDNHGIAWLTWQGKLYKSVPGVFVEAFSKEEANPFADGRSVREVWADSRGNVFLTLSKRSSYSRMMIAPKSPPPKLSISMEAPVEDSVAADLKTETSSGVQFRWQLDDEPARWAKEKTLNLEALANGHHTLSVTAIDGDLQVSETATADFEMKVDPEKQIGSLVKQLSDRDFAKREAAVAALARQPSRALPALKSAREKADGDLRWWIEAAIQEAEKQNSGR